MQLQSIVLQNFRSYKQKKIDFDPSMTIIIGPNTVGKTNCVEAIILLATGKSFRAEKDNEMIAFGLEIAKVQGLVVNNDKTKLEITLAEGYVTGGKFVKKFAVNDIPKSRNGFVGYMPTVLFRPEELEIIVDGPSIRREFLNSVLEQVDPIYRSAKITYDKALRRRNALLALARDAGRKDTEQFAYWDGVLIENGMIITAKREELIAYLNNAEKSLFNCRLVYDKSIISKERLTQYDNAEIAIGNTLVGPQRDDVIFFMQDDNGKERNIAHFASRGQQRLAVLQLKLLQMIYIEEYLGKFPLLVLDDVFSELDDKHIHLVLEKVQGSQIILTTTHEEFIKDIIKKSSIIRLYQ